MIKKFNIEYNGNNYVIVNENGELRIKPIYYNLSLKDLEEHKEALSKSKLELKAFLSLKWI